MSENDNNIVSEEKELTAQDIIGQEMVVNTPEEKPAKKEKAKKSVTEEIIDWVKTLLIGVIAGVFLVVFVVQRDNVHGDSMNPTLNSGDVIFTQKIATYFNDYDRGDIVILDGSDMEGYGRKEYLIKRIIGLPGETIRIADGNVYIKEKGSSDFVQLVESYLAFGTTTEVMGRGMEYGYDEITLGEDEYYCMGDNRGVSNDSRNLGPFSKKRIKAVAVIRVYPLNQMGLL